MKRKPGKFGTLQRVKQKTQEKFATLRGKNKNEKEENPLIVEDVGSSSQSVGTLSPEKRNVSKEKDALSSSSPVVLARSRLATRLTTKDRLVELKDAIERDDAETAGKLIHQYPFNINKRVEILGKKRWLTFALEQTPFNETVVMQLFHKGADLNKEEVSQNPLMQCISKQRVDVTKFLFLLEKGKPSSELLQTCLSHAVESKQLFAVMPLLKKRAAPGYDAVNKAIKTMDKQILDAVLDCPETKLWLASDDRNAGRLLKTCIESRNAQGFFRLLECGVTVSGDNKGFAKKNGVGAIQQFARYIDNPAAFLSDLQNDFAVLGEPLPEEEAFSFGENLDAFKEQGEPLTRLSFVRDSLLIAKGLRALALTAEGEQKNAYEKTAEEALSVLCGLPWQEWQNEAKRDEKLGLASLQQEVLTYQEEQRYVQNEVCHVLCERSAQTVAGYMNTDEGLYAANRTPALPVELVKQILSYLPKQKLLEVFQELRSLPTVAMEIKPVLPLETFGSIKGLQEPLQTKVGMNAMREALAEKGCWRARREALEGQDLSKTFAARTRPKEVPAEDLAKTMWF